MSNATAKDMGPQQTYIRHRQRFFFDPKERWLAEERTAVTVSMHKTNDSEVKYLESENEYSFHSCPNRSCLPGRFAWLKAKYPVVSFSVGTRTMLRCSYLRRKDGWFQLKHQGISKLLFTSARGLYALVHVLRTNHNMVAFSREGRFGL